MGNGFQENITNEEVNNLPAIQFGGQITIIENRVDAEAACADLLSKTMIGFDSETRPSFKAGVINKVALLQLSTEDRCYLFRLSKMALVKPILSVLESKDTIKIGADIRNDLRALKSLRHFRQNCFVDLQSIVSRWGIAEKSVRKMSGIILGSRVSKAQRLSNWEAASLTEAQQLYAATDAWVCLEIYKKLISCDINK